MKYCSKCNQDKNLSDFYKNKKSKDLHTAYCKECSLAITKDWQNNNQAKIRVMAKEWRASNPEKQLALDLKRYNLTIDEYKKMVSDQSGCCAICHISETELSRRLCVDHCHKTGRIRGLLCDACNKFLGIFKEDRCRFQSAADYLR